MNPIKPGPDSSPIINIITSEPWSTIILVIVIIAIALIIIGVLKLGVLEKYIKRKAR